MTCPACESAEQNPTSGLYQANCDGCRVRAIAGGRELFEASKAGRITPEYRRALQGLFGDDKVEEAHARVKAWREKLKGKQC
jgi:hypothetical protein